MTVIYINKNFIVFKNSTYNYLDDKTLSLIFL